MRGYVEESETVQRLRELREAARQFGAATLGGWNGMENAEERLAACAIAYAATLPRPRKKKSTLTKGSAR